MKDKRSMIWVMLVDRLDNCYDMIHVDERWHLESIFYDIIYSYYTVKITIILLCVFFSFCSWNHIGNSSFLWNPPISTQYYGGSRTLKRKWGLRTTTTMNGVRMGGNLPWRDNRIQTGKARAGVALHAQEGIGGSRKDGNSRGEAGDGFHGCSSLCSLER